MSLRVFALALTLVAAPLAPAIARTEAVPNAQLAVGPQYDTTHVYVADSDFDAFVASLIATFGGKTTPQGVFTVTPTPSQTMSQLVLTPVGTFSVFGFKTPVPAPFGAERTGYLLRDFDAGVAAARRAGADVIVEPFPDPIGRDVVVQWPGGVNMQFYWHTTPPNYPALSTVPENRIYVSSGRADAFVREWLAFSGGRVVSDVAAAPGAEIGDPNRTYRRIRIESGYGRLALIVTDGHLVWPYGRELTGYEVADLGATLAKATAAAVTVLVAPYRSENRDIAMVRFPGGYIAELHAPAR
jgi:hypothetical protein